jgi:nitrogen fixation/metabolism regulation signal transduction histidine kinase
MVPQPSLGLLAEARFLQATVTLPATLVANAIAVQEAYREYQERALAREGLRRMYIGTLTLALFLAVFGAVLLAIVLGNQLARPLLLLAAGVSEVAAGDLSPKPALQGKDELGGLTRAFADMTQQLAEARAFVDRSMDEVSAARGPPAGHPGQPDRRRDRVRCAGAHRDRQPGAAEIVHVPLEIYRGQLLAEVPGLEAFGTAVQQRFDDFMQERTHTILVDHWQQTFELNTAHAGAAANVVTLVVRGASLPGEGRLLVFDDISEIVSAQRAQAWGEVARRLAHEIKNPLTPIQLSAERLEMKLAPKLGDADRPLLSKAVHTIVEQVESMKRLVNEFRDYARLPAAELKPVDLNSLVNDVLHLYAREGDPSRSASQVPVRVDLDPACPRILGDAQQLRQVIHNLLQNAQDATEGSAKREVHGAHAVERSVAAGPPDRAGQRGRFSGAHPETRVRALRDHQGEGHGPGPRGREKNRG